ncbi:MAG: threonine synthase [Flammeovirgaceae bacterium]|nr:threonine synthase [Flammeovirgaceae bacterium]MDW8287430.1 threonine synthase [Flammeovirgaceae bacterium]
MKLYSTRRLSPDVGLREAIFRGLPPDNGLYMPIHIPRLSESFFKNLSHLSLQAIAFEVSLALIGDEVPENELKKIVEEAIDFEAPVVEVEGNIHALELFHGPTLAFKDFGARFMARLMGYFLNEKKETIHILVATSGDTGSAVAHGFLDVDGIRVTILYPSGKVSEIQEKQLTTFGKNITALEVKGTFDDCQRMVKEAFLDKELSEKFRLASANSINIARLIPQSFYYFYAFGQLANKGKPIVFCTPSGNFGNLCGGIIAKKMGLPVAKFVAATNANHIVPTYLETGKFEPKPSVQTIANAMDVGNPSNFPRLHHLYEESWEKERQELVGKWYNDEQILRAIREVDERTGYVMCPHSAVGYLGIRDYLQESRKGELGIFLATAHPAKFADIVETAIEEPVVLPERLQEVLKKPKQAILMENTFEALKSYLLAL